MSYKYSRITGTFGLIAAAIALSSCSANTAPMSSPTSSAMTDSSSMARESQMSDSSKMSSQSSAMSSESAMDPSSSLVGPGCADYSKAVPTGMGSVAGMATDPLSVAASHNPMLSTLAKAISGSLNSKV